MTANCKSLDDLPAMLTAAELAGALGISRAGAYALIHRKDFPTLQIGKRLMVPKDSSSPSGSASSSVTIKIWQLSRKLFPSIRLTVWKSISLLHTDKGRAERRCLLSAPAYCECDDYWLASSSSARPYFSAKVFRVPSSIRAWMAAFTFSAAVESFRKPIPYSSTDSCRSGITARSA